MTFVDSIEKNFENSIILFDPFDKGRAVFQS